ncbi:MAG: hypothetical protein ACLRSW_06115 [Christensenellaceae bacterium]
MAALNNTVWQKMYHYNVYACSPGQIAKYQVARPVRELPPAIAAEEGFVHTFIDEQAETFDLNEHCDRMERLYLFRREHNVESLGAAKRWR